MSRKYGRLGRAGQAAIMIAAVSLASSASARIMCDKEFQVTRNGNIATPYCEDNYLAHVARSYGTRVRNEAVRQNPMLKERLCRFIGYDIRVKDICAGYTNDGHNRR
ncbi:MAG: hypothetical protein HY765_10515 [Rhodomicrobium sp.]|nr:hypothetical protein [Rhodomicrobium sp.]